jgi:RNA polymerase sigma factor (sigma-70 family)
LKRSNAFTTIAQLTTISESELVAGLKAHNKSSLEYLYDRYSAALYGTINRIIPDEAIAEEVLHDAFLRIWDRIGSYDSEKGRLFTWMLNLTRNLAIDKSRSKEMSASRKTGRLEKLVGRENEETVGQGEDFIGLAEVLSGLPAEQKFVVEFLYLKGYTQSELADESGIPLGTVKTRLRLAMITLRTLLKVK